MVLANLLETTGARHNFINTLIFKSATFYVLVVFKVRHTQKKKLNKVQNEKVYYCFKIPKK